MGSLGSPPIHLFVCTPGLIEAVTKGQHAFALVVLLREHCLQRSQTRKDFFVIACDLFCSICIKCALNDSPFAGCAMSHVRAWRAVAECNKQLGSEVAPVTRTPWSCRSSEASPRDGGRSTVHVELRRECFPRRMMPCPPRPLHSNLDAVATNDAKRS